MNNTYTKNEQLVIDQIQTCVIPTYTFFGPDHRGGYVKDICSELAFENGKSMAFWNGVLRSLTNKGYFVQHESEKHWISING